ncbi:hypothetical protein D5H75_29555 [Bailinhaonella thermotolerans]|uniref:Uncharacterized protein n=1 Tax=Bailinhaonella thermotolerans TaxID=1070861 RepID=A0A3A4A8Y1_9ACTN|nr:hypothetical protein D5H75_29555 [Bailinhaonella thermotolerans]
MRHALVRVRLGGRNREHVQPLHDRWPGRRGLAVSHVGGEDDFPPRMAVAAPRGRLRPSGPPAVRPAAAPASGAGPASPGVGLMPYQRIP